MPVPKKKIRRRVPANKVSRACVHCKAAHVTCDSHRPCKRCVQKGLSASCQDAPRKLRKYLQENPAVATASSEGGLFESGFKQPDPSDPAQQHMQQQLQQMRSASPLEESYNDTHINQYFIGTMDSMHGEKSHYTFPQIVEEITQFKLANPLAFAIRNKRSCISFSIGISDHTTSGTSSSNISETGTLGTHCGLQYGSAMEIYQNVNKPYKYVQPYHDLNVYLRNRFGRDSLIQMARSMAEVRPSFIASMIRLKEPDLVFAEQCFQRTLLEYHECILLSGTPTIVWRRSCQIAYVSEEFTTLTGWTRAELLDKPTFLVQIMDDKSCVEYFRLFSKIAFGDFRGATMTECTLSTREDRGIRTTCVWTLKRDVFGIPMMIIGNFLPILT